MTGVQIVRSSDVADVDIVAALTKAFGDSRRTLERFQWKHREGPWGPSIGPVAVDDDGNVVGVRLFLPWMVRVPGVGAMRIARAVDGAVLPSARRQGLFTRMIQAQLAEFTEGGGPRVVYSTSVPASREAYRKLGWSIFGVPHRVRLSRPGLARVVEHTWPDLPDIPAPRGNQTETEWSAGALRWRTDPRSGRQYRILSLISADGPNGVIVRRAHLRRVPVAVIAHSWGTSRERAALERSALSLARGAGTMQVQPQPTPRVSRVVGSTSLSMWHAAGERVARAAEDWSFSFLDVEGVL